MNHVSPIKDLKKIDHIKRILKQKNKRDYCLFVLGINTGLRISDLLELKVSDLVDENGKPKKNLELKEKKTGKNKQMILNEKARSAIREYVQDSKLSLNDSIFKSQKGGPISREHAYRVINEAAKAVGIKERVGTHTLRKTFGYHAYINGVDISLIQNIFNHSAPSVTLRYIGIEQEDIDDVYININL
ncbi:site-specific integrase [Natranaerobius thermophilus]|uniref:Integrase family protein n=1 Tax=Natranaerobius thermophilus (strain ATCC BAA-1301 / DSM 18059 / JW/NM-WN-LF) TaxID=457570 RepID=B2A8Q1_NATTJ|nr:site-specific integrase [Natranaerobius thermophilus]ACB86500.1 integrase family protein [Natranaerobius thermophilus JW/NM-WN-LF]